ncbi:helicase-associated domain-containing protein [Streptomyces niveus]|uniref:helicase-associated domain-containing protein n=1 Tax=Streptomyces niveus TaxID=193462 RepID=UPI0036D34DFD
MNDFDDSTLIGWLRTLGGEQLQRLFAARPDGTRTPAPLTLGEFADRLQRTGSVVRPLERLPLPCLQAAEALAALPGPCAPESLERLLGTDPDTLAPVLDILTGLALVWPDANGQLHMAPALRRAWESPLGMGPGLAELLDSHTSEDLRVIATALGLKPGTRRQARHEAILAHHEDEEKLLELIDSAPTAARALLHEYAGVGGSDEAAGTFTTMSAGSAERWLLARALLVRREWVYEPAQVPVEVIRALRGPSWHAPFDPAPPEPDAAGLVRVAASEVEREASAAATAFAGQAAGILAECATRPPATLKSGGIGARELAKLGKAADCPGPVVRLVLETAYAAGLLSHEGTRVLVTTAYDAWAAGAPADRFTLLLRAWWLLGLTPSSSRDEDGKALPALARRASCSGCRAGRHGVVDAATTLPDGHGVRDVGVLGQLISWHRPFADVDPQDETPFASVIHEAELVGVLARGALSPLGTALLTGEPTAPYVAAARLLPAATGRARFGADLTAVVSGEPTARLATLLDSLADRESRSAASVWRFSPASVRRALDRGQTPTGIEADLLDVSETSERPLPQPLSYLIADIARRHGKVRVASASCVLHSEDTALLAEIAAHSALSHLGLRAIAPTVLLCRTDASATLEALRGAGYAPVAETGDGTVSVQRAPRPRADPPLPPEDLIPGAREAGHPPQDRGVAGRELAERLLASPDRRPHPAPLAGGPAYDSDTEEILDGYAQSLSLTDIRQFAHAIHTDEPLTIEYISASGARTVRTVSGIALDPPHIVAHCHLRDAERVFTISRIRDVLPA